MENCEKELEEAEVVLEEEEYKYSKKGWLEYCSQKDIDAVRGPLFNFKRYLGSLMDES